MTSDIIQDNTGGDPAGPDECGDVFEWDGTVEPESDRTCILAYEHDDVHEDRLGRVWS